MWKRIIKAWRVLRGVPTYNDDEKFMDVKASMESGLGDLHTAMTSVREFLPVLYTHQEFLRLNIQMRRLTIFIRNNYGQQMESGEHKRFLTSVDVAVHYMSRALEVGGVKVVAAPTEQEIMRKGNAVGMEQGVDWGGQ